MTTAPTYSDDEKYGVEAKDTTKARMWCFTWMNYTATEVDTLKLISSDKCDYLTFGFELAPTTQTPHLQGFIRFATPIARSTVKSRLDPVLKNKSKVRIFKCRGNADQNIAYCRKPESKDPAYLDAEGNPIVVEVSYKDYKQGERSDWNDYYDFLVNSPNFDDFAAKYPEIAIKYHGGVDRIIRGLKDKANLDAVRAKYDGATMRPWQSRLLEELRGPVDDRKVIWYFDEAGNSGKTWLSKYLLVHEGAAYFNNAGSNDIKHAYQGERIVVFDFTRSNEEQINYTAIEILKNGVMFSGKYDSRTKVFAAPHMVCMANYRPTMGALTEDRWDIRTMSDEIRIDNNSGGVIVDLTDPMPSQNEL